MKLIIAGTRNLSIIKEKSLADNLKELDNIISFHNLQISEIVSGNSGVVDKLANAYAEFSNLKLTIFEADWNKHGRSAGPIRNQEMAEYGDILLLIWDGKSKGSLGMKNEMSKLEKPIIELTTEDT